MTNPTTGEFETASAAAYNLTDSNGNANSSFTPPTGFTVLESSNPTKLSDGFSAVALEDDNGNIIIAFEGTVLAPGTTYGNGAAAADAQILAGQTSNAIADAQAFATRIEGEYGGQIYVTGHSLGGEEAEAAAQALGSNLAGGATFGAPGLVDNTSASGGPTSLVNYVDYGDPVGNYASDSASPLSSTTPSSMYHYGSVEYVGSSSDASILQDLASNQKAALAVALSGGDDASDIYQMAVQDDFAGGISKFHPLANYASDLGISPGTISSPFVMDDLSQYIAAYGVPLGSVGAANAQDETVESDGDVVTPDLTSSFNSTTNQITIDQTAAMTGSLGTIASGGVTTITLDPSTGLVTNETYSSPDGSVYSASINSTNQEFSTLEVNESNGESYQVSYTYNSDGSISEATSGYSASNLSGTGEFTQDTDISASDAITSTISGSGDDASLNNASIALESGAQAVIDGADNAVTLAASATLSLGSGSTGDTVTINSSGDSVNASEMASGSTAMVGSTEDISFSTTVAVDVAAGYQVSITGADGTMTASNDVSGGVIQNIINWDAGGSQNQAFSGLSSGVTQERFDYSGANLTGTLHDGIADYTNGTSTDDIVSGLGSGISSELQDYTGLNATGTLTSQTTDYAAGNSQFEAWNPSGSISTEFENFSGLNDTGTNTENIVNWSAGGSQEQLLSGLPSGVTEEIDNYAGANLTSTLINGIADYTNGTSTDDILSGLSSGVSSLLQDYTGLNATGSLTQETWDYTAGNSQYEVWNPTDNIAERFQEFSGLNDTGTDTENILDFTNGFSQEQVFTGMPSGVSSEYDDYTSANLTGTLLNGIVNYSAGTSTEVVVAGLPSNVSLQYDYFSEVGAEGQETHSTADLTNRETMDITYEYSGSTLEGSLATFYSGSDELGTAVYNASGGFVEGNGDFASDGDATGDGSGDDNGGGDGGYDGGYELTANLKTSGTNIGEIAQSDASLSPKSAVAAENARFGISALTQLLSTGSADIDTPFFEGAKWNSKVITWSLATSPGTAGSPFSGYMGTQYAALVQQAFQAWGAASGLTFVQVADSSNSDIRLGWGSFDTASSGVVGYTSYQDQNGQLDPNVIIRLENPSQDSLVSSATGTLTYSGTQANLYQVIAHEIGHALGLSDNVDPSSVMYYQAAGNSGTLDSNDIEGVQMLYGGLKPSFATASNVPSELAASEAPLNSMLQQMIQSAAAFNTQQSALTSFVPPETVVAPTLAAPQTPH